MAPETDQDKLDDWPEVIEAGDAVKEVMVGAGVDDVQLLFLTRIVTGDEVLVFPAASQAVAESVCVALVVVQVSQLNTYGLLDVTSAKGVAELLSRINWTFVTPTLSVAQAERETVPQRRPPQVGVGVFRETVGGVVSGVPPRPPEPPPAGNPYAGTVIFTRLRGLQR